MNTFIVSCTKNKDEFSEIIHSLNFESANHYFDSLWIIKSESSFYDVKHLIKSKISNVNDNIIVAQIKSNNIDIYTPSQVSIKLR